MLVIGVTGGIGSGKSTFAALLARCGAHLIDADELGHAALTPGQPAWHSVVDQFGTEILAGQSLDVDRRRLAAVVFNDPAKLAALNAILHPIIWGAIADELELLAGGDDIVVVDAALIVGSPLEEACDFLVVVDAAPDIRMRRVMAARGVTEADVRSRMDSQMAPARLLERADIVVRNDGSVEELSAQADRVWQELAHRNDA